MKPEEIDDLLRGEAELAWRPELTDAVMAGVHRQRVRTRWHLAGAAALLLAAVGIGVMAWLDHFGSTGVASALSVNAPAVETVRTAFGAAWSWLAAGLESAAAPLGRLPGSPGAAIAIAALILLVLINGATLGRPALARRRNS